MDHNHQKKIAVINDFCGFGRCSIAVALPIISAMKIQCCPLPTAIFSNHTGFDRFYWSDCTEHMDHYADEWANLGLRFNGIATGFLGSVEQIEIVERFLQRFGTEDNLVLVDPVMGDYGSLYPTYTVELAQSMKKLVKYAHILTPNLTEACVLTGTAYHSTPTEDTLLSMCQQLSDMGPAQVVISGLDLGDTLGNFIYERGGGHHLLQVSKVGLCRSGTGDVFSSILIADLVNGAALADAVNKAANFIAVTLKRTIELDIPPTDGICFEEFLGYLAQS